MTAYYIFNVALMLAVLCLAVSAVTLPPEGSVKKCSWYFKTILAVGFVSISIAMGALIYGKL